MLNFAVICWGLVFSFGSVVLVKRIQLVLQNIINVSLSLIVFSAIRKQNKSLCKATPRVF